MVTDFVKVMVTVELGVNPVPVTLPKYQLGQSWVKQMMVSPGVTVNVSESDFAPW